MCRFIFILCVALATASSAELNLAPESGFFGIPGIDSVSNDWMVAISDSVVPGFAHPVDMDVLRLSTQDYRIVFLDAYGDYFVTLPMDQQHGISAGDLVRSGAIEDTNIFDAAAMCQMRAGQFFDPEYDRVAVAFWGGATIGIYEFDSATSQFSLDRSFTNSEITRPVGIYWAFDQFFIVDETSQKMVRTDAYGNTISHYGIKALAGNGYAWMSDIDGFVDPSGTAHMYVCDGVYKRVDHLTATQADTTIHLFSQAWATMQDTGEYNTHEVVLIPDQGVLGLDRYEQRFYFWDRTDSLSLSTRWSEDWWTPDAPPVHIRQLCGRIVLAYLSADSIAGWAIRSYVMDGLPLDNPQPSPSGHWTTSDSPVIVFDSLHVTGGDTLFIDAGVSVLFDQGACLTIDNGARLEVNGTESNHVSFDRRDNGESWAGIYVATGQIDMEWADFAHASPYSVHISGSGGSLPPTTTINHCRFDGASQTEDGATLLITDRTSIQSVINSKVENAPLGYGMYLSNCPVYFVGDTIRNCSQYNSYIKNVTGVFRS